MITGENMAVRYKREEFYKDGLTLAKELIGAKIISSLHGETTAGIIVETEAYMGREDLAAHSARGKRDGRTRIIYGDGGYAYVHLIYGMYHCLNVVANRAEVPQCVLIRAIYPTDGLDVMKHRRKQKGIRNLCDGPGKVCMALGVDLGCYGMDLCGEDLFIVKGTALPTAATARINVDYAGEDALLPYRFIATDLSSLGIEGYERDYKKMLHLKERK
ncbi:MAG: DNA-3-methyladenine glycosylase [Clostridiales bacterium]|nr:DNA-3-methyladenine glycosylase [Clostridiales bacterium]